MNRVNVLIVAADNKVLRTLKMLGALSFAIPVVCDNWLGDSLKASKFLDPLKYIPRCKAAEEAWGFTFRASLENAKQARPMGGIFFRAFFCLTFKKSDDLPSTSDVKKLIKASGGEVIDTLKELTSLSHSKTCIILANNREVKSAAAQKAVDNGVFVLPVRDFILSLVRQRLPKDLEVLRAQKMPCTSMAKKIKDVMSKLSPVKSKNKSNETNANTVSLSPAAAADVDDVKPHTNDTVKDLWSYQTPKKDNASDVPTKMTLAACPNQQIVFKLRLTQSPYRSTSIKNETRDLGANGEILVLNYFDTDIQEVAYILNGGSLMFKAKVPKDKESSKVFMRIGGTHANAFCWDADNYAHEAGGTTIIGPITPGVVKKAHR